MAPSMPAKTTNVSDESSDKIDIKKEPNGNQAASNGGVVSILGYSLRAPNCSSVTEFADALRHGRDLTNGNTRYPTNHLGLPPRQGRIRDADLAAGFDPSFFQVSHKQAEKMDPLIRLLLQVSYEALLDAQVDIEAARGSKTGVYVGHCFSDVVSYSASALNPNKKTGYEVMNGAQNMAANRLSYFYDFKGPSFVVDTACSSSLVALHYAVRDLSDGKVDRALVAGLSLTIDPHKSACFNALGMLSPTGHCYTFDVRADGYCRSDGVACIVLERSHTPRGVASVLGTGTNSDGNKSEGITYPSATQQAALLDEVFESVSDIITPQQVVFHEAHGTGTKAGDAEELAALEKVYDHNLIVGSVKSNMGHAEGASGLIGIIKLLLMMEEKVMYPNWGFLESPHAVVQDGRFRILQESTAWEPSPCTVSSFGFGGTNAFCILSPSNFLQKSKNMTLAIPIGVPFAASQDASQPQEIHGKFYALQRMIGNSKAFSFVSSNDEDAWKEDSPLVFVCNGQGSQWLDMGQDLMESSPTFRKTIEDLEEECDVPLAALYQDGGSWMSKAFSVVGIVSFQLGMISIFEEAGIHPDYFLGHSLGELACSYLAGFASKADVLRFAKVRTELVELINPQMRLDIFETEPTDGFDYAFEEKTGKRLFAKQVPAESPPDAAAIENFSMNGKMAVICLPPEDIDAAAVSLGLRHVRVACFNSPKGQTISGPADEVDCLLEELKALHSVHFVWKVDTDSVAYHATYLKVFSGWLYNKFGWVASADLPSSWISTSRNKTFGPEYLVNNICGPVYFQEAIEALPRGATVVEVGPADGLLAQIKRIRNDFHLIGPAKKFNNVDVSSTIESLRPWIGRQHKFNRIFLDGARLPVAERYPNLWSQKPLFDFPGWKDFELPDKTVAAAEKPRIVYDLASEPWSSLRDHVVRGQNLFPATGFIHAIWYLVSFEGGYEMRDFRVHSPLIIAPSAKSVSLRLVKASTLCEVWDDKESILHASAHLDRISSTSTSLVKMAAAAGHYLVEARDFYPDVRRIGYEYGTRYQLLGEVSKDHAIFSRRPNDWISYMDAILHTRIFNESSFAYPVGIERVLFWDGAFADASLWVSRPQENYLGNDTVFFEGLRMEYAPFIVEVPTVHSETFVEYRADTGPFDAKLIAEVLLRENLSYSARRPLKSERLQQVVDELAKLAATSERRGASAITVGDSMEAAPLSGLFLTDSVDESNATLVASWEGVKLYRFQETVPKLPVVTTWKAASEQKGDFLWKGIGSSGAAATVALETQFKTLAMSCESQDDSKLDRVVKLGMRHNFVLEDGRHGVWVDRDETKESSTESDAAILEIDRPGSLSSLKWAAINSKEYTVKTTFAGLNFRDVMRASGQLKEKDLLLGLEFSGVEIKTGRRVFGLAKRALGTHCNPIYSYPTPDHFSDEEAASITVVYLTVYYALFHKANMKEGQSILIHAGTGGVGLAAITVALKRGLKVFTTCSAPKRDFLKSRFGLSDNQIGDSRSDSFVSTVLDGTNGKGVDVVLNQLAGPLQVASLRCIASGGHFCEIGKYDILQNTPLSQGLLAANISFHVIDLLPLLCDPCEKRRWDGMLNEGFERGEILPLPTKAFDASSAEDAFRFMGQGKHIGKIVVKFDGSGPFRVPTPATRFESETHMITGGLGGVGLSLACRLVKEGCRDLILVGRRGVTNGYQRLKIRNMEESGCKVTIIKSDLLSITPEFCPRQPTKIWHAATQYQDMVLGNMTGEAWDAVVKTKIDGCKHLRQWWPDSFIVAFSSVAAYLGNAQQTSYAYANSNMDAMAREDPRMMSIRLGPLDNVGFITKGANHRRHFERIPFQVMPIDGTLAGIMELTSRHQSGVFGLYEKKTQVPPTLQNASASRLKQGKQTTAYTLKEGQNIMSVVLGGSPDQYKPSTLLKTAGLDSLSTMEIMYHVQEKSGSQAFKPSDITESFTLQDMIDAINKEKSFNGDDSETFISSTEESSSYNTDSSEVPLEVSANVESSEVPPTSAGTVPEAQAPLPIVQSPTQRSGRSDVIIYPHMNDFAVAEAALVSSDFVVFKQHDIKIFNHGAPIDTSDETTIAKMLDKYVRLSDAMHKSKATLVSVIRGEVRGGGMIFPAMADVCVATKDATFGLPEVHRNMIPSIVSRALVERLGTAVTRRLSLTGESFGAEEALRLGLIDAIVDEDKLEFHVEGMLRRWGKQTKATAYIKNELVPKPESNAMAMGTVAGQWLAESNKRVLDDRKVLDVLIEDGVATLTMCDEVYRNTITFEMSQAVRSSIDRLKQNNVRAIILASSLDNFHVGMNPSRAREWKGRPVVHIAADVKECFMGFVELSTLGIPIIAVMNGKVYGGGLPIALWCDYRIATSDVDVHYGNITRGMSPAGQLSRLLREYLSPSHVMEAYLKNTHWDANDLIRLGIASDVAQGRDDAMNQARKLALFIAKQPAQAVRDTLHLVKLSYAADLANEEAWRIAEKIANDDSTFSTRSHETFSGKLSAPSSQIDVSVKPALSKASMPPEMTSKPTKVATGIIAMEVHTPAYKISADELQEHGIPARTKQGQEAVAVYDDQTDSISMALTAVSRLLKNHVKDPYMIGRIEVGTESNVDMAKSIKSYLMSLLPSDHYDVEGVDNTNACYGGTAALLNSLSWCRETGGYAIVVATDTADMDMKESGCRGAAAVAMLVGPDPWIEIHPEHVSCFKNTHDFLKPRHSTSLSPYCDTRASLNHYIHSLDYTINRMKDVHGVDVGTLDAFVFHGGICATFMKLVERHLVQGVKGQPHWKEAFDQARHAAARVGGMYTASMYVNLASLLSQSQGQNVRDVGLFSYGSGSTATLLRATIHHKKSHELDLLDAIEKRTSVGFDVLEQVTEKSVGPKALLGRVPGTYYRDVTASGIERIYFQE